MSTSNQESGKSYSERLHEQTNPQNKPVQEGDNDNHFSRPEGKCYKNTSEHSAPSVRIEISEFHTKNTPYIHRRDFDFYKGWLILEFPKYTFYIHGRNLNQLRDDLDCHKVTNIWVANYSDKENSKDPFVDFIHLKLNSEITNYVELPELPKHHQFNQL